MRSQRSIFTWLLPGTIALAVLGLAACGGGETATATSAPAAVQATPTTAPAVTQPTPTQASPAATPTRAPAVATPTSAPTATPTSAASAARRGGHFIFGVDQVFPANWDATQSSHFSSPQHLNRHYSNVLQFSPRDGATVMPDLAKEWKIEADATEFTLTLYEGMKWQDGRPATVDDIVAGIQRWIKPPTGIKLPRVAGFKDIKTVEKVDGKSFKVTIKSPNVFFLNELADPWHIIVPVHAGAIDAPEKVIGTGPFVISKWERGNFVTSTPYSGYHRTAPDGKKYPYLDAITSVTFGEIQAEIAAFKTKKIDLMSEQTIEDAQALKKEFGDKIVIDLWINPGLHRLALNNTKPPFDNFKARKAMYLAIDRVELVDTLQTPGLPPLQRPASFFGSTDPFWDDVLTLYGYDPKTRKQAVEEARKLAQESGLLNYKNLKILTSDQSVVPILQQQIKENLGLDVGIDIVDVNTMFARHGEKDFDLGFYGTGVLHLSPFDQIIADWSPGAGRNYGWTPPQNWLDLFEKSKRTLPGPELNAIWKEMDRVMREEWIPSVPAYRTSGSNVISWPYVKDFNAMPGCKFKCFHLEDIWVTADVPSGR